MVAPNEPGDVVHDYLPNETITVTPNNNDVPEVVTGRREMMIRLQMVWLFGILAILAYAVLGCFFLAYGSRRTFVGKSMRE